MDMGEVRLAMRIMFMKRCGVCRSHTSSAEPIVGASSDRYRDRRASGRAAAPRVASAMAPISAEAPDSPASAI